MSMPLDAEACPCPMQVKLLMGSPAETEFPPGGVEGSSEITIPLPLVPIAVTLVIFEPYHPFMLMPLAAPPIVPMHVTSEILMLFTPAPDAVSMQAVPLLRRDILVKLLAPDALLVPLWCRETEFQDQC